jgi:hypothetical protein
VGHYSLMVRRDSGRVSKRSFIRDIGSMPLVSFFVDYRHLHVRREDRALLSSGQAAAGAALTPLSMAVRTHHILQRLASWSRDVHHHMASGQPPG